MVLFNFILKLYHMVRDMNKRLIKSTVIASLSILTMACGGGSGSSTAGDKGPDVKPSGWNDIHIGWREDGGADVLGTLHCKIDLQDPNLNCLEPEMFIGYHGEAINFRDVTQVTHFEYKWDHLEVTKDNVKLSVPKFVDGEEWQFINETTAGYQPHHYPELGEVLQYEVVFESAEITNASGSDDFGDIVAVGESILVRADWTDYPEQSCGSICAGTLDQISEEAQGFIIYNLDFIAYENSYSKITTGHYECELNGVYTCEYIRVPDYSVVRTVQLSQEATQTIITFFKQPNHTRDNAKLIWKMVNDYGIGAKL